MFPGLFFLLMFGAGSAAAVRAVAGNSSRAWFENAARNPQDQLLWGIVEQYNLPHDALGATTLALIYSMPLNQYDSAKAVFPTNQLSVPSAPANGSSNSPAPNTDVLYGHVSFDLAKNALAISIPAFQSNRFYELSFYDIYQDDFSNIGVVPGDLAGKYLLRPTPGKGLYGLTRQDCPGEYTGCINSPGFQGHMLPRIELFNASDLHYVHGYLEKIGIEEIERSTRQVEPVTPADWNGTSTDRFIKALQVVALLGSRNPPQNRDLASSLPRMMECAGVNLTSQKYTPVPSVNITQAAEMWRKIENTYLLGPGIVQDLGNGWVTPNNTFIGNFDNGTDLVGRGEYQVLGNLANTGDEALYAGTNQTNLIFNEGEALLLCFSSKPPIKSVGFWNLEVYNVADDEVAGLVSNPQNIYSVGINGNLTYPDGTSVYGDTSRDEPFQVLFQSYTNPPPSNWTGNWLPTPEDGKLFRIAMRLYGPEPALLNGSYVFPLQKNISAITTASG